MKSRALVLLLALCGPLAAETVKDRQGAVLGDREKFGKSAEWLYNDLAAGLAEAARLKKPLLAVVRCVP